MVISCLSRPPQENQMGKVLSDDHSLSLPLSPTSYQDEEDGTSFDRDHSLPSLRPRAKSRFFPIQDHLLAWSLFSASSLAFLLLLLNHSSFASRPPTRPLLVRGWETFNGAGWGSAITQNHISWQLAREYDWRLALPAKMLGHGGIDLREGLSELEEYKLESPVCLLSQLLNATRGGGGPIDFNLQVAYLPSEGGGTASPAQRDEVRTKANKCSTIMDDMGYYADTAFLAGASDWIRHMGIPASECDKIEIRTGREFLLIHIRWGDLEKIVEPWDRKRMITKEAMRTLYRSVKADMIEQVRKEGGTISAESLVPRVFMENHNTTFLDYAFGRNNYRVVNSPSIQQDVGRLSCARHLILAQSDFSLMAAHAAQDSVIYYPIESEARYMWSHVKDVKKKGYYHETGEVRKNFDDE